MYCADRRGMLCRVCEAWGSKSIRRYKYSHNFSNIQQNFPQLSINVSHLLAKSLFCFLFSAFMLFYLLPLTCLINKARGRNKRQDGVNPKNLWWMNIFETLTTIESKKILIQSKWDHMLKHRQYLTFN